MHTDLRPSRASWLPVCCSLLAHGSNKAGVLMIHSDVVLHESPELHAHALFNLSMSRLLFNLYVNCCSEPIWLPSNIWN